MPVKIDASRAATGIDDVLQMMIVRSSSFPPVRGSSMCENSVIVSSTSPARSPQATTITTSTAEYRAINPCSTVLPAPNGPGMQAVPPRAIGKKVSISRMVVTSGSAENCRSLIESIAQEEGNRIPVLVRANPPGSELPYQLLVGSRRRFAIDWLNHNGRPEIRLNALIVELSDEEAFRLADIENREREDITELDRARSYQNAADRFYGGVQSRMAEALNLSNSQLSRLLALAQLPDAVIDAFGTRDELRVRHSEVLTPLLRRPEQRERVIAAARLIGEEQQRLAAMDARMLPAATVLMRLKDAATVDGRARAAERAILMGADKVGKVRPGRDGLAVDFVVADAADIDALLAGLRTAILECRASVLDRAG